MTSATDRIIRDAIRKAERIEVIWRNEGPCQGQFATQDREFAVDLANAYARMCDRQEKRLKEYADNRRQ